MESLQTFVQQSNTNIFNLTFTMSHDTDNIMFLDIQIHKDEDGLLFSSLYRKSTAGNGILHASSLHPRNLFLLARLFALDAIVLMTSHSKKQINSGIDFERVGTHKCLKRAFKRATTNTAGTHIQNKNPESGHEVTKNHHPLF